VATKLDGIPERRASRREDRRVLPTFLTHLIQLQLSRKTLRKHVNNLWVLGGEIIRKLNDTPSLRKVSIDDLVFDVVEDGGPLPYGCDSEDEGRSFESTCRRLRRFLEQQAR
jgi:hypothetical protein